MINTVCKGKILIILETIPSKKIILETIFINSNFLTSILCKAVNVNNLFFKYAKEPLKNTFCFFFQKFVYC